MTRRVYDDEHGVRSGLGWWQRRGQKPEAWARRSPSSASGALGPLSNCSESLKHRVISTGLEGKESHPILQILGSIQGRGAWMVQTLPDLCSNGCCGQLGKGRVDTESLKTH